MIPRQRMNELLSRIQQGTAMPEDYRALRELIEADTSGEVIDQVHAFHSRNAAETTYDAAEWEQVVQNILQTDKVVEVKRPSRYRVLWWTAAAAILVLAIGLFLYRQPAAKTIPPVAKVTEVAPILPGKNGAVLTLANGQTLVLDSMPNGLVAMQGSSTVQLQDGTLRYGEHPELGAKMVWNSLHTPRGSQYQLQLPDGSKVWLNAASSIRFPTAFTGTERLVEITGEVYLEVAKMANKPFKVKTGAQVVEVLGTHFNINAYEDEEKVVTTLLEGSVKIVNEGSSTVNSGPVILKPGQQAVAIHHSPIAIHNNVDVEQVVAWKNGFFHFDNAVLPVVMRQLSRWYDVDVVYEGHTDKDMTFGGKMGRDLKLTQVLKILQKSEVHFTIRDRKIIVMP